MTLAEAASLLNIDSPALALLVNLGKFQTKQHARAVLNTVADSSKSRARTLVSGHALNFLQVSP